MPDTAHTTVNWRTITTDHGTHTLASLGAVNGIAVVLLLTDRDTRMDSFGVVRVGDGHTLKRLVMIRPVNSRTVDPVALLAQAATNQAYYLTPAEVDAGARGAFCPTCGTVLAAGVCEYSGVHVF